MNKNENRKKTQDKWKKQSSHPYEAHFPSLMKFKERGREEGTHEERKTN